MPGELVKTGGGAPVRGLCQVVAGAGAHENRPVCLGVRHPQSW